MHAAEDWLEDSLEALDLSKVLDDFDVGVWRVNSRKQIGTELTSWNV